MDKHIPCSTVVEATNSTTPDETITTAAAKDTTTVICERPASAFESDESDADDIDSQKPKTSPISTKESTQINNETTEFPLHSMEEDKQFSLHSNNPLNATHPTQASQKQNKIYFKEFI